MQSIDTQKVHDINDLLLLVDPTAKQTLINEINDSLEQVRRALIHVLSGQIDNTTIH